MEKSIIKKEILVTDNEVYKVVVYSLCRDEKVFITEVAYDEEVYSDGCHTKYKITEMEEQVKVKCSYPVLDKGTNRLVLETNGRYRLHLNYDDATTTGSMAPSRVKINIEKISRDKAMALKFEDWQRI